MGNFKETLSNELKRAMEAVRKSGCTRPQKIWLASILYILKDKGYARVFAKNGRLIDVEGITDSDEYASFFYVLNQIDLFHTHIFPVRIKKLEDPLILLTRPVDEENKCVAEELW